jgi:hypothetical protein
MRGERPTAKGPARSVGALPRLADIEADVIAQLLAENEAAPEDGDDRRHLQTAEERDAWLGLDAVDSGGKGMAADYDYVRGPQLGEEAEACQRHNARRTQRSSTPSFAASSRDMASRSIPRRRRTERLALAMLRGKLTLADPARIEAGAERN